MEYTFDWKKYATIARQMATEGCVLVKNDNKALPLKSGTKVSVFGRIQFDYIKSGTGSGGLVNAPYVVSILDAINEDADIDINEQLLQVYEEWVKEHPFDKGKGWAMEPWAQVEMEVSEELATKAAANSDAAIVIIGRTAGEDRDNTPDPGSYYLLHEEKMMLASVTKAFERVIVVLNVGNIIDMNWVEEYNPQAVLYTWQGGMEGGHAVVDILTGKENPSGKLADTICYGIDDYPSTANFGNLDEDKYEEDIYVGYRYFETFAKDKVMYPFGFGLSYTTFNHESTFSLVGESTIRLDVTVTNTGKRLGKEVIQVYYEAPQGALCKPARNLIRFAKTSTLFPGCSEVLSIEFNIEEMASFDDTGLTGYKDAWVLEAGEYVVYVGTDVRNAMIAGSLNLGKTFVTKQCEEALAVTKPLNRMILRKNAQGEYEKEMEAVPMRSIDLEARIKERKPQWDGYTGDKGYRFEEVMRGEVSIEDYLEQLTDEELICMTRGEGMCSPKVTPGVAAAFGGVTDTLHNHYGMPIAACSDGPSGIRMDCGAPAFSLPSGTLQACSFNTELVEQLYECEGKELRKNKIDALLGPGINIHRNPLNGRNFEYYSEDPYLTGACASAELKGLHKYNVTGTCKHFAGNNQETSRHNMDATISPRALREIYLKAFEMAVKEGGAYCIMTTYGPLNGTYTSCNYDLATTILRKDWGYKGLVMTDWWAKINSETDEPVGIKYTTNMIRSQNDVYMVTTDSYKNTNEDDAAEGLAQGRICRAELLRAARNICYVLCKSVCGIRLIEGEDKITTINAPKGADREINYLPNTEVGEETILDISGLKTEAGTDNQYALHIPVRGHYDMIIRMKSDAGELSQTSLTVSENTMLRGTITINGTGGEWIERTVDIDATFQADNYVNLYFAQSGIDIDEIKLVLTEKLSMSDKRNRDNL
ncbi:MAG: glycoside hydrolase family 3 protein [Lachnospiraceae bacterium]|nr:glycoside hydrolase family 3 protein [Candidatus Colinaster equi]